METQRHAPALPTLEEFLKTPIGRKVPPVTRLIASKLESGDAPEVIARALGISTDIVNRHIKVIRCFPCRSLDEKLMEEEQEEEDMKRFAAALHKAVAVGENPAPPTHPDPRPVADRGEASQRAKVLEYLGSPTSNGKLSAGTREQLQMWCDGASQREVGRKFGVDQGNLSRRIKAVLNEAYKAAPFEESMREAEQEEILENQRREEALRKALAASDKKQIKALLSRHPRHNDAMHHATTGGKSRHERWAIDPDDLPSRKVDPTGHGPDR